MTVANSIKAQLDEAAHVVRQQMVRIAELEAEVERLRSAAGAHGVLKEIYADANQPTGHRIKAAGLAIGHEVPKLMPEKAPIDLEAEETIPLAELVTQRRARADALQREMRDIQVLPNGTVRILPKPGSNGGDSDQ